MKKTVIYLATPAYGCLLSNNFVVSLLNLQIECARRNIGINVDIVGNESLVQRARNLMTERFLRAEQATHFMFIDADIGFTPDAVFRLLDFDKDITSCVYPKKNLNWGTIRQKIAAGSTEPARQMGLDFNINLKGNTAAVTDGFVSVLDTATGFLLIKRSVIEKMHDFYKDSLYAVNDISSVENVKDYVALFDCMIDPITKRYLSEDYAFCRRWQQMDPEHEIWVDVRTPLSHTGNQFFARASA
jgi:hypothetical protein